MICKDCTHLRASGNCSKWGWSALAVVECDHYKKRFNRSWLPIIWITIGAIIFYTLLMVNISRAEIPDDFLNWNIIGQQSGQSGLLLAIQNPVKEAAITHALILVAYDGTLLVYAYIDGLELCYYTIQEDGYAKKTLDEKDEAVIRKFLLSIGKQASL